MVYQGDYQGDYQNYYQSTIKVLSKGLSKQLQASKHNDFNFLALLHTHFAQKLVSEPGI